MRRCLGCMEEFEEQYDICPHCGYEVGTPPREAYHMIPGTLLADRYLIGSVLGFGGFGVTYIGWDRILERKVAVKEYLPGEFSTRIPGQSQITAFEGERTEQFNSGLGKFLEEAKMLAKFEAANGIVQIYDSFRENGTAYIIMEYLEGKTLKTYLEQKGKLSAEEAKEILHPILTALKEVHEIGILHRDIAPDNIFLTEEGKVKLLDFGASRFATTSHSKSLSVIIKPGYAPVEQYRSRGDQGPWTDVYSLAATFYNMVTGVVPEDAMERVEKEELKKPSRLGIKIPRNVEHAIMNALNIKIEDRTQNIEAFEKELYLDEKVKLKFVRLKKADVGKWPLWSKLAVSAAVLTVAVFAGLLATGVIDYSRLIPESFELPEGMTRVPNLVNGELGAAESLMTEAGLILQVVDKQYSEYVPQDLVLSQNVNRGKIVSLEQVVEVVVSGGREIVIVQDVCGSYKEEALAALTSLGLIVEIQEEYSEYAEGVVMEQSVAPGEQTHRGETVVLTVSKGYDTFIDTEQAVTIPDLTGMSLDEAREELKKYGLSVAKESTKEVSGKKAGSILEQTPAPGTQGHQGDVVKVVLAAEKMPVYMPDTQYKDMDAAVSELEKLGLKVAVEYEENATVAQGKVIRQSITAYGEVKEGAAVTLTVSSGTPEINQIIAKEPEWSGWVTELPAGVNKSRYEIETKKQYSFRDKSTTSSLQDSMPGWTLYDKTTSKGDYGEWSTWSGEQPAAQEGREIQQKEQYSYRDYEKTTSDQSSMSGWEKIDTRTYYLEDYGNWSEWSTAAVSGSSTRKVETKTQYQSRTRSWTTASTKSLSGYTYSHRTESAGSWTEWSETPVSASETESRKVEVKTEQRTRQVQTGTKTYYKYYHWYYWYTPESTWYYTYMQHPDGSGRTYASMELETLLPADKVFDGHTSYLHGGKRWFLESTREEAILSPQTYTVYSSLTTNYTYHFYKWSDWSGWSDTQVSAATDREVNPRTVYRYADKIPHYEYTYGRWKDWTAWSDDAVADSSTREVRKQTIYKYRDMADIVTYHYYQWGNWSEYRDERPEASGTREVQERTLYRYKEK
ncbi:MAG: PASTA domain-containing protein [Roseburia sp.]|nr:PASTA domain-containing protein [Roseburia sp.]MCM1096843.1 PASTA domain-containing protein [Ruminococcus flavefaciens]